MPVRIGALDEARRRSRAVVVELGYELGNARRSCGTSQATVGRALRWSQSKVSRIERGSRASVTVEELASFASVVGLRFSPRLFVGGPRLRDATQISSIASYRAFAHGCGWDCRIEEPLPITGDPRAFDLVIRSRAVRVAHEFVSRLRDAQGQVRPILIKQRDAGVASLILVLRDTAENRRAVREAGPQLMDLFPLAPRTVLAAIRELRDPGGNGIVFWRASLMPPRTSRASIAGERLKS
jgi:transcriptional regulator with XRE-family HTH domain